MADNQNESSSARVPDPESAEQDAQNAANQDRVRRDHDELQRQADRVGASVPPEVRDRTVGEIVQDVEERARRADRG